MTVRDDFRYVRRIVSLREGDDIPKRGHPVLGEPARDIWRILRVLAIEDRPVPYTTKSERWYVLFVEEDLGP